MVKKKKKEENKSFAAVQWMSDKVAVLESIAIGILLIGLVGGYLRLPFSNPFIIFGFGSLAMLCYILGYAEPKDPTLTAVEKVLLVARGSATAVCLIGILFSLQAWIGNRNLLVVGAISLGTVLAAMVYFHLTRKDSKDFSIENLLKTGVILVVTLAKLFI